MDEQKSIKITDEKTALAKARALLRLPGAFATGST